MGGLTGLRVATFESRRADEVRALILHHGGTPLVAPSLVEESSDPAPIHAFADTLLAGGFDLVILLTGVGTAKLASVIEERIPRAEWLAALAATVVVARSQKPAAALRDLGAPPPPITAPEPHTWREIMAALAHLDLAGRRIAVQEYGAPTLDLVGALTARGALVTAVPVYRWQLPADTTPLRQAVRAIAQGEADVLFFMSGVQVIHLLQIAAEEGVEDTLRAELTRMVVASVGPATTVAMQEHGLPVDLEPEHPRMGQLLKDLAGRALALLATKRAAQP